MATKVYSTVAGLNAALRRLPKEASVELRKASMNIAVDVASKARARAYGIGGAYRKVAPTLKARRDRIPVIAMGGSKRLRPGPNQTVGNLIWGAEFGGQGRRTTQQFLPHKGQVGYALWPTVRANHDQTVDDYKEALEKALKGL